MKKILPIFRVYFCCEKKFGIFLSSLAFFETQFGIFCLCGLGNTVHKRSRIRSFNLLLCSLEMVCCFTSLFFNA